MLLKGGSYYLINCSCIYEFSELHRYVFLLFKQNGKLTFEETRLAIIHSGEGRRQHHVSKFAEKYGLGNPVAGNYYQAEWDDYVPTLHKQLFGK